MSAIISLLGGDNIVMFLWGAAATGAIIIGLWWVER